MKTKWHSNLKEVKSPLFTDDTVTFAETPKDSTILLELIIKFSKVPGYKNQFTKQLHFHALAMNNSKGKLRKHSIIPFIIASKRKKRNEDSLRDLWDNVKQTNIPIIGVPEGGERENEPEKYLRR